MVVATGRLSSSDPNLQNIPIKGVEGRKIREAFVPEEGFIFVSSDYSQIELRVLAHVSGDELSSMPSGTTWTSTAGWPRRSSGSMRTNVTPAMRRTAKVINFGIVYGISGYGLSKELGVGPREAQAYIDAYFERHRGIKAYIERTLAEARETGLVRTLFGRIRYIPELSNADANVRQFGERTAINTPIQGTAADIIKMAMVAIYRRMKERRSPVAPHHADTRRACLRGRDRRSGGDGGPGQARDGARLRASRAAQGDRREGAELGRGPRLALWSNTD